MPRKYIMRSKEEKGGVQNRLITMVYRPSAVILILETVESG